MNVVSHSTIFPKTRRFWRASKTRRPRLPSPTHIAPPTSSVARVAGALACTSLPPPEGDVIRFWASWPEHPHLFRSPAPETHSEEARRGCRRARPSRSWGQHRYTPADVKHTRRRRRNGRYEKTIAQCRDRQASLSGFPDTWTLLRDTRAASHITARFALVDAGCRHPSRSPVLTILYQRRGATQPRSQRQRLAVMFASTTRRNRPQEHARIVDHLSSTKSATHRSALRSAPLLATHIELDHRLGTGSLAPRGLTLTNPEGHASARPRPQTLDRVADPFDTSCSHNRRQPTRQDPKDFAAQTA